MIEISLGQRLHELRDKADLSLRELARKVGISGPFLSDIELGRRFPSEEILAKLAGALNVPLEDLKQHDNREPIADFKRLMDSDPKLGFAFRTAAEKIKSGELTAEELIARGRASELELAFFAFNAPRKKACREVDRRLGFLKEGATANVCKLPFLDHSLRMARVFDQRPTRGPFASSVIRSQSSPGAQFFPTFVEPSFQSNGVLESPESRQGKSWRKDQES